VNRLRFARRQPAPEPTRAAKGAHEVTVMVPVCYQNERLVEAADPAPTLLEVSRRHGIAHASACGGHARCSTCRVLVVEHPENLSPPTEAETVLAARKGFGDSIRLACQTRPLGPVTVRRLVLDDDDLEMAQGDGPRAAGEERTLAVLFSDIRGFTPFAESHLAYDVVHILNRYFRRMGDTVLRHGGYIDKYIGDGLMALFGLEQPDADAACRAAVACALEMLTALPELNAYLARQFGQELRVGIGVHAGAVIVADLGHPLKRQLTAIGDVVNVASRIETATKEVGVSLLVSDEVLSRLGPGVRVGKQASVPLKGVSAPPVLTEIVGLS
jgi:adenylate cyclase